MLAKSKGLLGIRPTRNKNWKPLWGKRLGELTEMWHTQKMQEQTGLTVQMNNEKTESSEKTCSKSSVVVAPCLLLAEN
jgi:hypothetical protein